MGSQASDRLVGRAEELGVLDQLLVELDAGRPAILEVVGEPGIGKTCLLRELAAGAEARRLLVLTGSGSELETDLPFSVFVDALDEYLRSVDHSRFDPLDEDVRAELAHVFPSLSSLGSDRQLALQHERYRSHRAVRELLEHLSIGRPLVLVLDDLHWADSASIELLGALLRRPPAGVLLAFGARQRQVPERLSHALERANRDGPLTRVELGPLSRAEAHELVGRSAESFYEESGGNPFYLEQLARSGAGSFGQHETLAGTSVPSAVLAALTEELTLVSGTARLALDGAAVAGDPFEPELAAAAAELSETDVMGAVDQLLAADLLRQTDVPRRFQFRHPLVRRAVYDATAAGWRLGAHERCAQALAERGAPAAVQASHVERSAREGDAAAADVLRKAGEETTRLAPASAAHWFAEARRLLPPTAPTSERLRLLDAQAAALTAVGRFADSHAILLEAVALSPNDAPLAHACASAEFLLGRHEDARRRLETALVANPDRNSRTAAALMIDLGGNGFWRARFDELHEWSAQAAAVARSLDDLPLLAAALAPLALADSLKGEPALADAHLAEAAAIVDTLSDAELAEDVQGVVWLAGTELYLDRYAAADEHATRALAIVRASGQGEHWLILVETLGGVWRQRGKLVEAAQLLDGGIEAARLLDNTQPLVWSLSGRSSTALRAGDVALALETAQESFYLARHGEGFHSAEAAADFAAALLETHAPDRAEELLLDSAGGEELTLIAGSPRTRYLEVLARARLLLGRVDQARESSAFAEAWASSVQLPMAAVWAGRASAAVDLDEGDAVSAAERALSSAAGADMVGAPVEAAISRTLAGRALAAAGDTGRADAELQNAAEAFEAAGALRSRDEVERELRKLGRHIYRRSQPGLRDASGLESLTERELQIARLVVDRKTNPEIAAELFLSVKTVETHLRNTFRKVGVANRVELARAIERAPADPQP
jgi:DNA-binding CsgD family transcriptional regulator